MDSQRTCVSAELTNYVSSRDGCEIDNYEWITEEKRLKANNQTKINVQEIIIIFSRIQLVYSCVQNNSIACDGNHRVPVGTSGNLLEPVKTSWNQLEPVGTSWNQLEPVGTFTLRC